mmetsp:Transcript_34201/g.72831  ORF Transcript_34201/g.72831 Transcript_34201/m.72831 type:complete len:277 (+) Transcript_34201:608-1438(+)
MGPMGPMGAVGPMGPTCGQPIQGPPFPPFMPIGPQPPIIGPQPIIGMGIMPFGPPLLPHAIGSAHILPCGDAGTGVMFIELVPFPIMFGTSFGFGGGLDLGVRSSEGLAGKVSCVLAYVSCRKASFCWSSRFFSSCKQASSRFKSSCLSSFTCNRFSMSANSFVRRGTGHSMRWAQRESLGPIQRHLLGHGTCRACNAFCTHKWGFRALAVTSVSHTGHFDLACKPLVMQFRQKTHWHLPSKNTGSRKISEQIEQRSCFTFCPGIKSASVKRIIDG